MAESKSWLGGSKKQSNGNYEETGKIMPSNKPGYSEVRLATADRGGDERTVWERVIGPDTDINEESITPIYQLNKPLNCVTSVLPPTSTSTSRRGKLEPVRKSYLP